MITVRDLKKTYSPGTRSAEEVLHGVSFDLPDRGFVCILGRSGSGKTSLLNAVGGLDVFDSGTLEIDGTVITRALSGEMERRRNADFGYVFQNYYLLPEHSVAYNVYLGLHSLDLSEKEKLRRVGDALEKVDMLRFRKRLVGELSGGQQQRVAIARALAKAPKVIFADEPTGNLDEESTLNICSLLKQLSRTSLVVMVTHEERLADFFADRIITIEDGLIKGDDTDWERGTLVSADRDTIYAGDLNEKLLSADAVNIRVLAEENAQPADLTIVIEDGRLIIKTDDQRLVQYSRLSEPPFVSGGKRPVFEHRQFDESAEPSDDTEMPQKHRSGGLGLRMLLAELKTSASEKKLRSFATGLFIVLLSVMLLISVSDIAAAAKVQPEDFITKDSHVLELRFGRGPLLSDKYVWTLNEYIAQFLKNLEDKCPDFDLIPDTNERFTYYSTVVPQYGVVSMSLGKYDLVDLKRLDESTLIYGRMPERYDEIVVDRWVIKNCTGTTGIVQNLIPDNEYMIGKSLVIGNKHYYPTIVGICDSGEPSIYMKQEGMLSVGIYGLEVISYSEFVSITGMTDLEPVASGEAVILADNVGSYYLTRIGQTISLQNGAEFRLREAVEGAADEYRIAALMIISDDDVYPLLRHAIESVRHFSIWCADKEAVKQALAEPLPEGLEGMMKIDIYDTYGKEYSSFMARRSVRLQTRFIITAAAGLICLVMLYIIQRTRVRDRMSMIAVYRLLGIPGRDAAAIFIAENILLTLKFALPAVFLAWAAVTLLPLLGVGSLSISIPLWVPAAVLGIMIAAEIVVAVLPVLRLLALPPARLASKYDL